MFMEVPKNYDPQRLPKINLSDSFIASTIANTIHMRMELRSYFK